MSSPPGRPRLLVFNQYYWPGVEATANLLSDLCEELAADFDVTVVTGRLLGFENAPGVEHRRGVEIVRVRSTAFDRAPLFQRAANYLTYLAWATAKGLALQRPDVVLCMTDPPMVGDVALLVSRRFRVPLVVISQDVFPEIATQLGRLRNPIVVSLLRWLVGFYLRRADTVVAIGERMRERLIDKGVPPERVTVIPNWVDVSLITPQSRENDWKHAQALGGQFLVMHSGNVGHAQNLDTLVYATTYLRDLDDFAVAIIGFGARHAEIQRLAERLEANSVRFLGYEPREVLSQSLSAADVHYVGLAPGLAGFVVPSRLYGIMAAGRPVIVAADGDSEITRIVTDVGCGVVVPPDRPDLVAAAIRSARDGRLDLEAMGAAGRDYVVSQADRRVAVGRYRTLLTQSLDTRG